MRHWASTNIIVAYNLIGNSDGSGMEIRPSQSLYTIHGNECYNNGGNGILIGDTNTDFKVTGNRCYANVETGLRIAGSTGAAINKRFYIAGNIAWNNDSGDSDTYDGIHVNYTDSSMYVGNMAYDNQSTVTQQYGHKFDNCTDMVISFDNSGTKNETALMNLTSMTRNSLGELNSIYGQLLFFKDTAADDELIFLYDPDFASVAIQSGGDSRWWIATDTTGSNNTLEIGADGNTSPAVANYAISIDADEDVTIRGDLAVSADATLTGTVTVDTTALVKVFNYGATSSGNDTYVVTLAPAPTSYQAGMVVWVLADVDNTGACTLNVNSLGAKNIKDQKGDDPGNGHIDANSLFGVIYDGTNFVLLIPDANP